jgi:hypothetical protein
MSRTTLDRLFDLLPAYYRERDLETGGALRAVLQVIAEQVNVVESGIDRMYDDWFIETCQDWLVPYIGELIGYKPAGGDSGESTVLSPRRDVANTIRHRRRKGTMALLEQLAFDVGDWPARVVPFYRRVAVLQNLKHLRLDRGRTLDLRDPSVVNRLGGAFDRAAHLADFRPSHPSGARGAYDVHAVGLYVWRIMAYAVTRGTPYRVEDGQHVHFTFSALGDDIPLFNRPVRETDPEQIAAEANVPAPIPAYMFRVARRGHPVPSSRYYGEKKSLAIYVARRGEEAKQLIDRTHIVPGDLSNWSNSPPPDHVMVDVERGRFAFHPNERPGEVVVSYHYGFPADIGGGEYRRPVRRVKADVTLYHIGSQDVPTLADAIDLWHQNQPLNAIMQFESSGAYDEPDFTRANRRGESLQIRMTPGQSLELRAALGTRPILRLPDIQTSQADGLIVRSVPANSNATVDADATTDATSDTAKEPPPLPRFKMTGLLVARNGIELIGPFRCVTVSHCTLVPGWHADADRRLGDEDHRPPHNEHTPPSIDCDAAVQCLTIDHSVIGPVHVHGDRVINDPVDLRITDSIVDAVGPTKPAFCARGKGGRAHAELTIVRTTVIGDTDTHAIKLAENSIFDGALTVARTQTGCMRFCYYDAVEESRPPRRYHCQPDLAIDAVDSTLPPDEHDAAVADANEQVRPRFNSVHYGTPSYCQLADDCPDAIARGADDGAAMGVYHDLLDPIRAQALRRRINEHLPAGSDATVFFVT